jgi:hypothetical protein
MMVSVHCLMTSNRAVEMLGVLTLGHQHATFKQPHPLLQLASEQGKLLY